MNTPSTEFSLASARLADFPQGWERHPNHPGIVLIKPGYTDLFLAAANDESCQAAILAVTDEQKAQDTKAIEQAIQNSQGRDQIKTNYSRAIGITTPQAYLDPALPQIIQISKNHCAITDAAMTKTSIIQSWRTGNLKSHPKHSKPVTNRVFFSGGTMIKTNEGWFQTPEAYHLHMKALVKHSPELETDDNMQQARATLVSREYGIENVRD